MISTNKSTSSVDELFSNAFAVWKSQGIYDLEKRLAAGSRVKKSLPAELSAATPRRVVEMKKQ